MLDNREIRNNRILSSLLILMLSLCAELVSEKIESSIPRLLVLACLCAMLAVRGGRELFRRKPDRPQQFLLPSLLLSLSLLYKLRNRTEMHVPCSVAVGVSLLFFVVLSLSFLTLRSMLAKDKEKAELKDDCIGKKLSLCAIVFTVILAGGYIRFYPYGMSPDVENQLQQIAGEIPYNTIHTIGHTLFLQGMLKIFHSLKAVIMLQILAVLAINLAFSDWFLKKAVSLSTILLIQGLPMIWMLSADRPPIYFLWKDTPAAVCLGIVMLFLMKSNDGEEFHPATVALIGTALAWCYLFRLNGIIALIVCASVFIARFIKGKKLMQLGALLLSILIPIVGIRLKSDRLEKSDLPNGFSVQVFASGLAAMVTDGTMTEEELNQVGEILPLDWIIEHASREDGKDLIWTKDHSERIEDNPEFSIFNNEFVLKSGENRKEIIFLYFRLMPVHFAACVRDVIRNTYAIWGMDRIFFVGQFVFLALVELFAGLISGLPLREWTALLPLLCNTLSIAISTTTNEPRYLLPTQLFCGLFVLYSISARQGKHP